MAASLRFLLLAAVALLAALGPAPARGDCRNSALFPDPDFPGLPVIPTFPAPPVVVRIYTCGTYTAQLQSGALVPELCVPDTFDEVESCVDLAVQLGLISAAEGKALKLRLRVYCR